MAELEEICRAARDAAVRGEVLWLATVMRVRGSAYRHAGAQMLFSADRVLAGSVSGGCLEGTILRKGPWLSRAHPACIQFDGGVEDGLSPTGTGCDGSVDILVERLPTGTAQDPLAFMAQCLDANRSGALITVFESRHPGVPIGARCWLGQGEAPRSTLGNRALVAELGVIAQRALADPSRGCRAVHGIGFEALLQIVEPAPHLFVFGSGPDTVPVVELAHAVGLRVTVCSGAARVDVRERFAHAELHLGDPESVLAKIDAARSALAVLMSHHYPTDLKALRVLLRSGAEYIGLLGAVRRSERLLHELSRESGSLSARDRARLHAPIGLDLGAQTPAQIALSIIAELQAVLARASAQPLSRCAWGATRVPLPDITMARDGSLSPTGSS